MAMVRMGLIFLALQMSWARIFPTRHLQPQMLPNVCPAPLLGGSGFPFHALTDQAMRKQRRVWKGQRKT